MTNSSQIFRIKFRIWFLVVSSSTSSPRFEAANTIFESQQTTLFQNQWMFYNTLYKQVDANECPKYWMTNNCQKSIIFLAFQMDFSENLESRSPIPHSFPSTLPLLCCPLLNGLPTNGKENRPIVWHKQLPQRHEICGQMRWNTKHPIMHGSWTIREH